MAWQDVTIPMVRILINDFDNTNYDYSDDRLEQTIVVAAQLVNQEIEFDTTYTINIPLVTISPDPSSDESFINFISLKASCLVDQSTFRTKAAISGLKAKCGPAVLETVEHMRGFRELLTQGPCAAYKTLKNEWLFGNTQIVKAILSPFVSNNFDPRNLPSVHTYDHRSGY